MIQTPTMLIVLAASALIIGGVAMVVIALSQQPGQRRRCERCGDANRPDARFCARCGATLDSGGPEKPKT